LATIAQAHADRCSFMHDNMIWRSIPGTGQYTGQNIVMIEGNNIYNWTRAFDTMFKNEEKLWQYGRGMLAKYRNQHAAHYTQVTN
jgi:hypothetical protein